MVSAVKCMLAVAIVASVACSAYAVSCYTCESLTNPKCGEKFESDNSFKYDCHKYSINNANAPRWLPFSQHTANATGCMKVTLGSVAGKPLIKRSCYFGDINNHQTGCGLDPSLPQQQIISCDVCSGNLCNGSSATGPIAITLVLFFALARIFS